MASVVFGLVLLATAVGLWTRTSGRTRARPADAPMPTPMPTPAAATPQASPAPSPATKRDVPTPMPMPMPMPVPTSDSTRVCALLVEDDPVNRKVAQRFLEKLGCTVTTVDNGSAAVEAVQRSAFDIVFMDCQMPV